jgi:hypothetical protein
MEVNQARVLVRGKGELPDLSHAAEKASKCRSNAAVYRRMICRRIRQLFVGADDRGAKRAAPATDIDSAGSIH